MFAVCFRTWSIQRSLAGNLGPGGGIPVYALTHIGSTLYAGTSVNGIFVSSDNGLTWRAINSGLTSFDVNVLAAKGSTLFAGTGKAGVFRSLDGKTWEPVNGGLTDPYISAIAVLNDRVFVGTDDGMFVSTNNGQSWSHVVTPLGLGFDVQSIAVLGSDIYATASNAGAGLNNAIASSDLGQTWRTINNLGVRAIGFAKVGSYLFSACEQGMRRSSDNGKTWVPVGDGLFSSGEIVSIGSNLYAASVGGVFVSLNNGDTWLPISGGLADTRVYALDVIGTNLVAGTSNGTVFIHSNPFPSLAAVSAATYKAGYLPSDSLASLFGTDLAPATLKAETVPLPINLAGVSIKAIDSANVEKDVPLLFVSPGQINCQIPKGLALGPVSLLLTKADGSTKFGDINLPALGVAPGLFSANADSRGAASASIVRVKPGNVQTWEPVAVWDPTQNKFVTRSIDFGPTSDFVYLVLYGTGIRAPGITNNNVTARVGQWGIHPSFVGAQGNYVGLDQINLLLPRSLAGTGEVDVYVSAQLQNYYPPYTLETFTSNTVKVRFQ